MSNLGVFAEGFQSWRKVIAAVPLPARKKIFENIARDVARYVKRGLDKSEGVDQLYDIAMANGLITECGEDHIQLIISDAFLEIEREAPDSVPNGKANGHAAAIDNTPLPYIDISHWDETDAPERGWLVDNRIPERQPTIFSGEGGGGKSTLLLQLCVATIIGGYWIGHQVTQGPATYLGAEDEADEIRRRIEVIAKFHGVTFKQLLEGGLRLLSYAGEDAVLGTIGRDGRIVQTDLYRRLYRDAAMFKPKLVALDTISDIFIVNEINRSDARQAVGLGRKIAMTANGAVVFASHPSVSGRNSGTGESGSTGWSNSVRSRMYLRSETEGPDNGLRVLEFKKSNYGPISASIQLIWKDGLYRLPESKSEFQRAADDAKIDELIFKHVREFNKCDTNMSVDSGKSAAPPKFCKLPDFTELNVKADRIKNALRRLIAADKLIVKKWGPPSKKQSTIIVVGDAEGQLL